MLALTPKFHEEVVFQSDGVRIGLKFYLDKYEHLRLAIDAPRSVVVTRKKIKGPVRGKAIRRYCLEKMGDKQESR